MPAFTGGLGSFLGAAVLFGRRSTGFGGGDRFLGPARRCASWFVEEKAARRFMREEGGSDGLWSRSESGGVSDRV